MAQAVGAPSFQTPEIRNTTNRSVAAIQLSATFQPENCRAATVSLPRCAIRLLTLIVSSHSMWLDGFAFFFEYATVGKFVTVKATENRKIQQPSTIGL